MASSIRYLRVDGRPTFLVGLNYWPSHSGPLMWQHWRPDLMRRELAQMRALGLNVIRFFLLWSDFHPTPDVIDPLVLGRLAEFLDLCAAEGLRAMPSFFVGHMSGENWDVPWRQGRDFYRDPFMRRQEAFYLRTVVQHVRQSPALAGWLLTNELPHYAGDTDPETGVDWASEMTGVIRALDPARPISLGDGSWQVFGNHHGLPLEPLAKVADYLGPHLYVGEGDPLRHSYVAAYATAAADYGLPVVIEEFGTSTVQCSQVHQADYFRTTYHSSFAAGAAGTLGWCYADVEKPYQRPYSHHPFEMYFGVTTAQGRLKPAALEIARFARLAEQVDLRTYRLPRPRALAIEPSALRATYPFYGALSPGSMYQVLLEAFTLSRQAGLDLGFWREPVLDCRPEAPVDAPASVPIPDVPLLLGPHLAHLTAPAWQALTDYARRGGTLYLSYCQHGLCMPNMEELTGCRHELRPGLCEFPAAPLEITLQRPLASLPTGTVLRYNPPSNQVRAAYCPLDPVEAEVLAVDGAGRPALVQHPLGAGRVIFSAYPLEYYLLHTPDVHRGDGTWRLYRALRDMAGLTPLVEGDNPFVEVRYFEGPNDLLVWAISHSWQAECVRLTPHVPVGPAADLETGRPTSLELDLPAMQVRVLRIPLTCAKCGEVL